MLIGLAAREFEKGDVEDHRKAEMAEEDPLTLKNDQYVVNLPYLADPENNGRAMKARISGDTIYVYYAPHNEYQILVHEHYSELFDGDRLVGVAKWQPTSVLDSMIDEDLDK